MSSSVANEDQHVVQFGNILQQKPVLSIDDIHSSPCKEPEFAEFMQSLVYSVVMDNNEIMFCNMQLGSKEARDAKDYLAENSYHCVLRPTTQAVINFLKTKASNDPEPIYEIDAKVKGDRTPAQQLLDNIVHSAVEADCSDIHVYSDEIANTAKVYFTIDDKLVLKDTEGFRLKAADAISLGSVIIEYEAKSSGGSSAGSFDNKVPGNASVIVMVKGRQVKIRYNHIPITTPRGIGICMRVLSASGDGHIPSLDELGYGHFDAEIQKASFKYSTGLIIYTGPTGSGKSTALSSGVSTIPKFKKIISLEDPVENRMPGVLQIQVDNENEKLSYKAFSKAVLRQAPHAVIYGEINDEDLLKAVITQAGTGHLIVSTLHANCATEVITRMVDMGASWDRLASESLLRMIVAQRLIEKLCASCSVPIEQAINQTWSTSDHYRVYQHFQQVEPSSLHRIRTVNLGKPPCIVCKSKGEIGRVPIAEVLKISESDREFIASKNIHGWVKKLKQIEWKNMHKKATDKVLQGEICPLRAEEKTDKKYGMDNFEFHYGNEEKNMFERERLQIERMISSKHKLALAQSIEGSGSEPKEINHG